MTSIGPIQCPCHDAYWTHLDSVLPVGSGIAGKPAVSIDDAARVLAAYRECEGFTTTELQKARESFDKVAVKDAQH